MFAIVEIPESIKAQIIQEYLNGCHKALEASALEALEASQEAQAKAAAPTPKQRASKARMQPAESGGDADVGTKNQKRQYYRDNIQINSLDDLPKGVQVINGRFVVYRIKDGKRVHHGCYETLAEAVVEAHTLYSNLPDIEVKHYRSLTDWLILAAKQ